MGYPTKVQLIQRKKGADRWYINFPTAVAEAMGLDGASLKEGAVQTISDLGERGHMARDHSALVCKDGRKELEDWEGFCNRIVEALKELMK